MSTFRNKGGRPRLSTPPTSATECRALIAQEVVKTKPRERTIRCLYRLLQAFERAEIQAAAEKKNRLLEEANALKRAEYQRRYALGQQTKALKAGR